MIEDALDIIERSSGERPDMTTLPLDDGRTYEMLARGDSTGVFQFESEGMREALKKVRPDEFNDLVALNALYRPGAMDQIPVYAKGKHNPEPISYPDERLRPILESSNGVILYQEQAMQISKELAGFSGAKADDLRKAIGKKNRQAMAALKPEFVEGCRASGTKRGGDRVPVEHQRKVRRLLVQQEPRRLLRADRLPHRLAEGQPHRRVHGRADLLGDVDEGQGAVLRRALRGDGHRDPAPRRQPLRPRVHGRAGREPGGIGSIRFGLDAVKGVGYQAVEAIKRAREDGGEFTSIWDFCERVDSRTVNKKAIEALVKCGALGSTGATRKGMLEVLEKAQAKGQQVQQDAQIGQGSIFDLQEEGTGPGAAGASAMSAFAAPVHAPIPTEEFEQPELLAAEKEAIGLFVSAHPLKPLRDALRARVDCPIAALEERRDKDWVTVGGIITEAKRIRTRNGDHMMFATLDDLAGSVEMLVFGKALAEHEAALAVDEVVIVKGRVDHKEAGKTCLVVQSVERFAPSQEEIERASKAARTAAATAVAAAEPVKLRVAAADLSESALDELRERIEESPGTAEVIVEIDGSDGITRRLRLGEEYRVRHTPTLLAELEQALRASAPRRDPAFAQLHRERDFLGGGAAAVLAGGLEHARQLLKRRRRQERGAALLAQLSAAEVGVAVAVGAERCLRVVEVQRAHAAAPELARALAQRRRHPGGGANVIARRQQVAGVKAHAQPRLAAGALQQPRQLVEGAAQRAARAGGVLQVQLAALAVPLRGRCGERLADRLARARERLADVARLGRARVQHHARGADRVTDAQRMSQRRERFRADVPILARAVEQVHRMDQHRVDRARAHRLAKRRHVLVAVGRRTPHARRLVEDLDRAAAALDAALDRLRQAARGGYVRAD